MRPFSSLTAGRTSTWKPYRSPGFFQLVCCSGASFAEPEIFTNNKPFDVQGFYENLFDEFFRGKAGSRVIESGDHYLIDMAAGQGLYFFAQWCNGCGSVSHCSGFQREVLPWMRVESQYGRRQVKPVSGFAQSGK